MGGRLWVGEGGGGRRGRGGRDWGFMEVHEGGKGGLDSRIQGGDVLFFGGGGGVGTMVMSWEG